MLYQAAALVSAALYHHSCPEVFILLKLWALSQRRRWHLTVVCLPLTFTHLYSFTHSLIYHLIYIIRYVYYWLQFCVDWNTANYFVVTSGQTGENDSYGFIQTEPSVIHRSSVTYINYILAHNCRFESSLMISFLYSWSCVQQRCE